MGNDIIRLIFRLKNSVEGKDFIEYLQQLSLDNYKAWKKEGGDVLRGKALAFDELILLFENVEEALDKKSYDGEWM